MLLNIDITYWKLFYLLLGIPNTCLKLGVGVLNPSWPRFSVVEMAKHVLCITIVVKIIGSLMKCLMKVFVHLYSRQSE